MITEDESWLKKIRALPCIACGKPGPSEPSHIWAKGMGGGKGGDDNWNVKPLCGWCHTKAPWAWHGTRGVRPFFAKYPHVKEFLQNEWGWEFYENAGHLKMVHPAYRDQKPKEVAQYTHRGSDEKI